MAGKRRGPPRKKSEPIAELTTKYLHLYKEGWTLQRIADAEGYSKMRIQQIISLSPEYAQVNFERWDNQFQRGKRSQKAKDKKVAKKIGRAMEMLAPRACRICDMDISHRGHMAIYCEWCFMLIRIKRGALSKIKKHVSNEEQTSWGLRFCRDCGLDISDRHVSSVRCIPCTVLNTVKIRVAKARQATPYGVAISNEHREWVSKLQEMAYPITEVLEGELKE